MDPTRIEPQLVARRAALAELCRVYGVATLDVFGSAADGRFDPQRSDYDFIARFAPNADGPSLGRRFIGFADALEALLGRRVDVMTDHFVENPYLRRAIESTRIRLVDDAAAEAPV
jgi:uncharacterized protein